MMTRPMTREQQVEEMLKKRMTLDSKFYFRCTICGKCCKNREDILISPYDLFRMLAYLKEDSHAFLDRNCIVYTGEMSRMPLITFRPVGPEKVCPLLKGNECMVHACKPTVCALFPLGRVAGLLNPDKDSIEIAYIMQDPHCGDKNQRHTVREWLKDFDLEDSETWFYAWAMATAEFSERLQAMEKRFSTRLFDTLQNLTLNLLYLGYDYEKPFLDQFQEHCDKLRDALDQVDRIEQMFQQSQKTS